MNISMDERIKIAIQIVKATWAIQKGKLIHGDLKPNNILLTLKDNKIEKIPGIEPVVIIDFGQSKKTGDGQQVVSGTPCFTSPEQTAADRSTKTDNYNIGIILALLFMQWPSCWAAFLVPCGYNEVIKLKGHFSGWFAKKVMKIIFSLLQVCLMSYIVYIIYIICIIYK